MKGTSKLIMLATVLMVVILAIVLGLVLFLLAELYCSLLLGRRRSSRKKATTATNNAVENSPQQPNAPSLLRTLYSQGVLQAPRNFLFPTVSDTNKVVDLEKQFPQSSTPPFDPWPVEQLYLPSASTSSRHDGEQLIMYICNPIYDNEAIRLVSNIADNNTPFETPDTSPSRLETIGSSRTNTSGTNSAVSSPSSAADVITPPLTPMKRLLVPAEASSICLRDARSLCTTGSDSISNYNEGILSSSSGSPCTTSASW